MTENHSKYRSIIEGISGITEEKPTTLSCRNADRPLVIFVIVAIIILAVLLFFAHNAH